MNQLKYSVMNFSKQIERLQIVDKYIKEKSTGTPEEFASLLRISKRQLFRILEELKDYGAPIAYNRTLKTFYYQEKNFEIKINFSVQFISEEEKIVIAGS